MSALSPKPIAVRLPEETVKAIDQKRVELAASLGAIPSRSDVLRFALDAYLDESNRTPKSSQ